MALPRTPTELTVEWLNEHLPSEAIGGATVTGVTAEDIGTGTGIFGQIARLRLTLDNGGDIALVAKLPCTEEANLQVALMLGIYEREINMFKHVIGRSSLTAPRAHVAMKEDDGSFVIVMDDMSTDWEVGDQIVGATLAQAESIVDALVAFHAEWWEHPDLEKMTWLPRPDAPQYVAAVPAIYSAGLEPMRNEWSDRLSEDAMAIAHRLEPKFEDLLNRTAGGPTTLIHTDTRLDNIFFARDGSPTVAFIDFQLALAGRGVADVAYLVATSVPREIAKEHWEQILHRWHDGITAAGITYPWDDCLKHYREAALYYLSGAMSLIGTMDAGNERGAQMAEAYVTRSLEHVVDIKAASVL